MRKNTKKHTGVVVVTLVITAFFALVTQLSVPQKTVPAVNGILDLSSQSLDMRDVFKLDGQWELYWNRLLNYGDFQNNEPDLLAEVPNMWTQYEKNGGKLPGEGFGTYRLHLITSLEPGTRLALRIGTFSSAYRLYIDNKLTASAGEVTDSPTKGTGKYKPQTVSFQSPAHAFDIIIQVSNYDYARGGFWSSLFLGSEESISNYTAFSIGKELFLIGVLVIVAIFHLALYALKPELKSYLYSSCFCLVLAVMIDTVSENNVIGMIPGLSIAAAILIWYSSTNWTPFFLVLFTGELFQSRFAKISIKVYFVLSLLFQLLFLFTPATFYTKWAMASDLHDFLGFVCAAVIVAIGIKKGHKDGWLNMLSMFIVLVCYIHDGMYLENVISASSGEILYAGLLVFILLQMLVQVERFKELFDKNAAAELNFLQAQIKPHFLYNALNTFVAVSYDDEDKARELMVSFGEYLRKSFDFKNPGQFVPLQNEIELARYYVSIEKARFEERLEVTFAIDADTELNVPRLMLEPIIENAVNHGVLPRNEGGHIEVTIKQTEHTLEYSVRDNGIGMEPDVLEKMGEHEGKGGVGLRNIDSRLKRLYGKGLLISSVTGEGTEVSWSVPLQRKERKPKC